VRRKSEAARRVGHAVGLGGGEVDGFAKSCRWCVDATASCTFPKAIQCQGRNPGVNLSSESGDGKASDAQRTELRTAAR
jgi:hypothetical protein